MHTIVAFSDSKDPAGVFVNLDAVPDPHIKTQDQYVYISNFNNLIGRFACLGANADQARLYAPSIRNINPLYINEIINALVPDESNMHFFHPSAVIPLVPNEGLEVEENSDPDGAEQHTVIVALAPGAVNSVNGDIRTVHFTSTVTLAAETWAFAEIELVDDLPVGNYNIVGARLESATSIAFRFVPVGESHRPGGICVASEEAADVPFQRLGGLGIWCGFNTVQLPGIEVLDSAATGATALDGYFDLIKA
jgi:hypothetical protein